MALSTARPSQRRSRFRLRELGAEVACFVPESTFPPGGMEAPPRDHVSTCVTLGPVLVYTNKYMSVRAERSFVFSVDVIILGGDRHLDLNDFLRGGKGLVGRGRRVGEDEETDRTQELCSVRVSVYSFRATQVSINHKTNRVSRSRSFVLAF